MLRYRLPLIAAALLAPALAAQAAHAEGLLRIEPRPYYGAVVSIEHGVRVFRPLPNTHLMIINPGDKTPISLSFSRTIEHKAAESNSGGGNHGGSDGEGGNRSSGFSGLGTNPQSSNANAGSAPGGVGIRPSHKSHIRKAPTGSH